MVSILVDHCNDRDIIDFVGTPPYLKFALPVAMATMHFHKVQTCVSFKNIFFILKGVLRSNLAPIRKCHNSFLVALNLNPKSALNLKIKNCTGLILSREGMN